MSKTLIHKKEKDNKDSYKVIEKRNFFTSDVKYDPLSIFLTTIFF